jgi:hypothetical protein
VARVPVVATRGLRITPYLVDAARSHKHVTARSFSLKQTALQGRAVVSGWPKLRQV